MSESEFGLASMYRIIKKSGGDRGGDDAADELRIVLEGIGISISKQAVEFASHAGRKTIRAQDIKLAAKSAFKIS